MVDGVWNVWLLDSPLPFDVWESPFLIGVIERFLGVGIDTGLKETLAVDFWTKSTISSPWLPWISLMRTIKTH